MIISFVLWRKKQAVSKTTDVIRFDQEHFNKIPGSQKEKYLDSIVIILKNQKNESIVRELYLKTGEEYYYLNNIVKSYSSSLIALRLSNQEKDSSRIAKSFYYIGDCYEVSQKDSAYYYYLQAQKIYTQLQDYKKLGRIHFNKAYILFYDGRFVECEVELTKALKYLKDSNNTKLLYTVNNLMGNCLEKLFMYDQALKYHQLGLRNLQVLKNENMDTDEVNNYNASSVINICNLYDIKGDYSHSIKELSKLLTKDLRRKWPYVYASVLSNLAYSKMKNKEYKNVESMYFESLKIIDSLGVRSSVAYKKFHLGELYLAQKDTLKAVKILKEGYKIGVETRSITEILSILKLLSKIDNKRKLFFANQYIEISDSINSLQSRTSNKYARIEYETTNVENENKVLTKKNFYILIFSFGLFLILSAIFVFNYLKYKNKELKFVKQQQSDSDEIYQLLSEQQEKINNAKEEEKNKIAKELHDGIMNRVYGVRMNLGFFNSKVDEKTIEKRKEYIFELENIENEIRSISHDLSRDSFLENSDFNTLISDLIKDQKELSATVFNYIIDKEFDWESIANIYKINFYRIIQEALLNIHKYSDAEKVDVKIQLIDNHILKLSIIDDGIGFDVQSTKKGIGLRNIKERANSLNGNFEIKSKIGEGTEITVTFTI
ncbi:ATP-binding protein [Flavobacterium sp. ov086]|uniref:tetratricopeptide repeat-containing sensor histidine kinase n=1 Tax=Flavobacterium sp. ov086 TaxID=1761785 RepID=UPI000B713BC6|nr:ATP-binding protein [Flavobacterium sp. ov086]SNR47079.1 Histidine kinase-, DNA gyrase B-, and HSP90-like ATPase [Flavobacterium sp. ov086]